MKTNARQNTGKNVKISSKGFAIRTEKSNAKQITKGNAIPTGSKSAINCTKMSNKSIKQKNAKIKRCENAKSIGKRVPMGPKIGSIIQLPARPFGRPTATPSPSTRPYLIKLPGGDPIECAIIRIPMNSPMLKSIN